jgi:hypothetical protein
MKTLKSIKIIILAAFILLNIIEASRTFAENNMEITTGEDALSIFSGDCPLLYYPYNNVPFKPYVRQLFSPAGANILRDAPADHLHHHALMFAVKVDGINFWEETPTAGKQIHKSFTDVKTNVKTDVENNIHSSLLQSAFTEHIDWTNQNRELLLKERRTIDVRQGTNLDATLVTWKSEFELPDGKESATITGAHYHGLGMRFLISMDTGGHFLNADNKTGTVFRGQERLLRSTWCAYTADADGKSLTVAMFDHPDNPRHPATWFTMTAPFAYLSATLKLHEEPLKIVSGKPLILSYAVAVWDGNVEAERINKLYQNWIAE